MLMVEASDKQRYATGQLLNFARDSYLERTSRPIYAAAFLLPFIIVYEIGTILINTDVLRKTQIRVVAFDWLQRLLEHVGAGDRLAWAAPPLVAIKSPAPFPSPDPSSTPAAFKSFLNIPSPVASTSPASPSTAYVSVV